MLLIKTCSDEEFWAAIKSGKVENLNKLNYSLEQFRLTTPSLKNMGHFTPLQWCAAYGHYELMQELIKVGVDVNAINDRDITATILAAANGHKECLALLIKAGAKLDVQSKEGWTASICAERNGHKECLKLLKEAAQKTNKVLTITATCSNEEFWIAIKSGKVENLNKLNYTLEQYKLTTPSNLENMGHFTPLQWCAAYGHYEILQELITVVEFADVNARNDQGMTAAILAASNGHTECLELLIKAGAKLDIQDKEGWTAAIRAAANGHKDCLELLIKGGAKLNIQDEEDRTSVMWAANEGHKDCLELLIKAGVKLDIQDEEDRTAVICAAANGHKDCLELLIKAGVKLNIQDEEDRTAVICAAANGHKDCLELLIKAGAKLNIQDKKGVTAAIDAAANGHKDCLDLLIKAGIKLDIQDKEGWTAVMWTVNEGHKDCLELLIKAGAKLNIQNEKGRTAVMWAAANNHKDCLELLIKAGAELDIQDKKGVTAVIYAAANNHKDCLGLLIKAGAELDIQDKKGVTAVICAAANNHKDCLDLLIKAGIKLDIQDKEGRTAVMWAAANGYTACLELLKEASQNPAKVLPIPAILKSTTSMKPSDATQPKKLPKLIEKWCANLDVFFTYETPLKQEPGSQVIHSQSPDVIIEQTKIPFSFKKDSAKRWAVLEGLKEGSNICFGRLVIVYKTDDKRPGRSYGQYNYKLTDNSDTHVSKVYEKYSFDEHRIEELGFTYIPIPGDGHCLYRSVSLYLGESVSALRQRVADYLDKHRQYFANFVTLSKGKSLDDYINAIRNSNEWADNIETEILMQILGRPILVIGPDRQVRNPNDRQRFKGEPIFVYYNGTNHYDGLVLKQGVNAQTIFTRLQNKSTATPQQPIPQADKPSEINPAFVTDLKRYHPEVVEEIDKLKENKLKFRRKFHHSERAIYKELEENTADIVKRFIAYLIENKVDLKTTEVSLLMLDMLSTFYQCKSCGEAASYFQSVHSRFLNNIQANFADKQIKTPKAGPYFFHRYAAERVSANAKRVPRQKQEHAADKALNITDNIKAKTNMILKKDNQVIEGNPPVEKKGYSNRQVMQKKEKENQRLLLKPQPSTSTGKHPRDDSYSSPDKRKKKRKKVVHNKKDEHHSPSP